ncbi:MAG: 3-phosphoshikimate 1-carboxyvinyltransferase [Clostridia bacterium]|nr:3-phosphoshikimate 1-carboxyvinyltransferase [Clostridia bacterium]
MTVEFIPTTLRGAITAPPSKSIAHRCLISCYLAGGGTVENIAYSEDVKATINCIRALGGEVQEKENEVEIKVNGTLWDIPENPVLNANESGSTLRFFIPICMAMGQEITLKGTKKLLSRPLGFYEELAKDKDFDFSRNEEEIKIKGNLKSGIYRLKGNITSQYITGLMFVLPLLDGDSKIIIEPPFESRSYVVMTAEILGKYGIETELLENEIRIKGGQTYKKTDYRVDDDMSNGAYLEGYNYCGENKIKVSAETLITQGDSVYKEYLEKVKNGEEVDLTDCPDLGPLLYAVASANNGGRFKGTDRLSIKESDRNLAMQEELKKFGTEMEIGENEVVIKKSEIKKPTEILDSHNDHRIFMALSILLLKTGGKIKGAECVKKSFPDYIEVLEELGAEFNVS